MRSYFCPDINILISELEERGFTNDSGNVVFPISNRTSTKNTNNPKTTTLVRCSNYQDEAILRSFTSLEVLGTYDEVFADDEKYAKYSSAYPHEPYTVTDPETGEEITITPPKKFGTFA